MGAQDTAIPVSPFELPAILSSDIKAAARLAVNATAAITDVVEAMHHNIAWRPRIFGALPPGRTRGISGRVYGNIRTVTGWVGSGLDVAIAQLQPIIDKATAEGGGPARDAWVAALNGVLGDYLAASRNPLAIQMELRMREQPQRAPGGRMLLMIHGLCMNDLQWHSQGHDHGAALARDLGYQPAYLRYNSGLHISVNGRELAQQLERWLDEAVEPVAELAIIGHSMGGLVARSACHYAKQAGHRWLAKLRRLVFIGTPHFGAPLERGGNWLDRTLGLSTYSAPLAALGKIRSAGITDLRHGSLLDEDWQGTDRFQRTARLPLPVPLPAGVYCASLAGSKGRRAGDVGDRLLGDGLVPVASALGRHADLSRALPFEPAQQWIGFGVGHLELLHRPEVYAALCSMLSAPLPLRADQALENR